MQRSDLLFTDDKMEQAGRLTSAFCTNYLSTVSDRPIFQAPDRQALRAIIHSSIPREGVCLEALFEELENVIVPNSTHTAHPRFLPYVQPTPNGISPYAEAVTATINQNCNLWTLSPAANAVEQAVLGWFHQLFGFGAAAGGILTSGGLVANLVGLTAARDHALGAGAREHGLQSSGGPLTLYTSEEVHSSVDKAVSILGLGKANLRKLPTRGDFTLDPQTVWSAITKDRAAGARPFCIIASTGTVTTGAFDPIGDLADLCMVEGLWLHVDGAYGALSAMSNRFAERLRAVGRADSISLDPHKLLFASFEAGCVLVKDRQTLRHAFSSSPSYLDMNEDPDFVDFANYGPQLSRSFRALKIWWSLKHFGFDAYARTVDRMNDLAVYMAHLIERSATLELLAPVTYNCVCFRRSDFSREQNATLLRDLTESGLAFLGPAKVRQTYGLRACFMNLRATKEDVEMIISHVLEVRSYRGSLNIPVKKRQNCWLLSVMRTRQPRSCIPRLSTGEADMQDASQTGIHSDEWARTWSLTKADTDFITPKTRGGDLTPVGDPPAKLELGGQGRPSGSTGTQCRSGQMGEARSFRGPEVGRPASCAGGPCCSAAASVR